MGEAERHDMMLELLKRMHVRFDQFENDLGEVKTRLGSVEYGLALLKTDIAHQSQQIVSLGGRMDRFDDRLKRIERRLDLTDA